MNGDVANSTNSSSTTTRIKKVQAPTYMIRFARISRRHLYRVRKYPREKRVTASAAVVASEVTTAATVVATVLELLRFPCVDDKRVCATVEKGEPREIETRS